MSFGGARRDRTADLLHAMQALSQLSYGPENEARNLRQAVRAVKGIVIDSSRTSHFNWLKGGQIATHHGFCCCSIFAQESRSVTTRLKTSVECSPGDGSTQK